MNLLRRNLLIGVVLAVVVASVAGFLLDPSSFRVRVFIDAGLLGTLVIVVLAATSPGATKVQELVDALRELSLGHRERRVNPDEFGPYAEIARAVNEVAASLTEHDDKNLGPVQSRPRIPHRYERKEESDHPDVGAVRVRTKTSGANEPAPGTSTSARSPEKPGAPPPLPPTPVATPSKARAAAPPLPAKQAAPAPRDPSAPPAPAAPSTPPEAAESSAPAPSSTPPAPSAASLAPAPPVAREPSTPPTSARASTPSSDDAPSTIPPPSDPVPATAMQTATGNDTIIDVAAPAASRPPPDESKPGPPGSSQIAEGQAAVPSRDELEALFHEFVTAKKAHGESAGDLDFDAFADTIAGECERLIRAHECKGVRFEVTMQDGEVSLRPRLLR